MNIWHDRDIREALKERDAEEISVLQCPACRRFCYYNDGSHFHCPSCRKSWSIGTEDECITHPGMINVDDAISLADLVGMEIMAVEDF